jgi:hypothetical protein
VFSLSSIIWILTSTSSLCCLLLHFFPPFVHYTSATSTSLHFFSAPRLTFPNWLAWCFALASDWQTLHTDNAYSFLGFISNPQKDFPWKLSLGYFSFSIHTHPPSHDSVYFLWDTSYNSFSSYSFACFLFLLQENATLWEEELDLPYSPVHAYTPSGDGKDQYTHALTHTHKDTHFTHSHTHTHTHTHTGTQ